MADETRRIGNYEVYEKIGAGSVGAVYKAKQLTMARPVALRVLDPKLAKDTQFAARFLEEARAAGRLIQANVCQLYEVGEDKGLRFIAMELVEGPSFEALLARQGRLPAAAAIDYLRQGALALQALHRSAMVHGNIKPSNLIVTGTTNELKLVDLGTARDPNASIMQAELGPTSAVHYMAPERGQGLAGDLRGDIYALGATFYHMLAGRPPFTGPHATAVLMKHAGEPLVPLTTLDASLPKRLAGIIDHMMAKSPSDRYQTPDELLRDIDQLSTGRPAPVLAPREARAPAPRRAEKRAARPAERRGRTTSSAPALGARNEQTRKPPPVVIAGAALVGVALALLLIFAREDPALKVAEEATARARMLVSEGTDAALQEASRLLREVIAKLPEGPRGKHREDEAMMVLDRAEDRLMELNSAEIARLVSSVRAGTVPQAELTRRITQLEQRYADAGIPQRYRDRLEMLITRARADLAVARESEKVEEAPPPKLPAEVSAIDAIRAEVDERMRSGQYAQALGLVDAVVEAAGSEAERRRAREVRSGITAAAESDFAALRRRATSEADAGRLESAKEALEAARARFAFPPYEGEIVNAIARIDGYIAEKAAAARAPVPLPSPAPATGQVDEAAAKTAVDAAVNDAVNLIQTGQNARAKALLERLGQEHGRSQEYERRAEEVKALLELAGGQ